MKSTRLPPPSAWLLGLGLLLGPACSEPRNSPAELADPAPHDGAVDRPQSDPGGGGSGTGAQGGADAYGPAPPGPDGQAGGGAAVGADANGPAPADPADAKGPGAPDAGAGNDAGSPTRIVWQREVATSYYASVRLAVAGDSLFMATVFADVVGLEGQTFMTRGGSDTLLAAYSLAGDSRWIRQVGGASTDAFKAILATKDALVVMGIMGQGVDLGGQLYQTGTVDSSSSIVARYNHAGDVVWWNNTDEWRRSGSTSNNAGGAGTFLLSTPSGQYLAGFQGASALFTPDGTPTKDSAHLFPGDRTVDCGGLHPDGGLLIAGTLTDRSVTLMGRPFAPKGPHDGFAARFAAGGALAWVTTFSGSGDDRCGGGVVADAHGDVYVVCHVEHEIDIGGKTYGSTGGALLAKLAGATGKPLWVKLDGGSRSPPVVDGDSLLVVPDGLGVDFGLGILTGTHLVRLSASTGNGISETRLPDLVQSVAATPEAIFVAGPKFIARLRP